MTFISSDCSIFLAKIKLFIKWSFLVSYLEILVIFTGFETSTLNILLLNLHKYAPNLLCIFVAMLEALLLIGGKKTTRKCQFWRFSTNFGDYLFGNDKIQLLEPARGAAFSSIKKNSAISKVSFYSVIFMV